MAWTHCVTLFCMYMRVVAWAYTGAN